MEDQRKEPGMSKFNRMIWYIMGIVTFVIFLVVFVAIMMRGTGY
jgi:hypothetical protein